MSGQQHAPAALYPREKDQVPILQEAGWAPGPVWTRGKYLPHLNSIPDRPARSSVAIPTELPGPELSMYPIVFAIKFAQNSHCLSHNVHARLSHQLVAMFSATFTPHILLCSRYLTWPCSHYVLDSDQSVLERNLVTQLSRRVRTACTPSLQRPLESKQLKKY